MFQFFQLIQQKHQQFSVNVHSIGISVDIEINPERLPLMLFQESPQWSVIKIQIDYQSLRI